MDNKVDNTLLITCFNIIAPHIHTQNPFTYSLVHAANSNYIYNFAEQFFFSSFYYKNKFKALDDLYTNSFISQENKDRMINYFYKAQKLCVFFKKFYIKKTFHKYKIYNNDIDLNLKELESFNQKYIISIIENNVIYKFTIFDILKIIKTNLCYTYAMFVEPRHPRNPYTNINLSLNNLYNIYFFTKRLDIRFPVLLSAYFQSNFNLDTLTMNYESIIRDEIIKNYYKDTTETKKYRDIIEILEKYKKYAPTIIIHRRFSKKEVVSKLGFLLEISLYVNYSYNPSKRIFYKSLLKKKLTHFSEENPLFGRIIVKRNNPTNRSLFNPSSINNSIFDYTESVSNTTSPVSPFARNNRNINNTSRDYINHILNTSFPNLNENNTIISSISTNNENEETLSDDSDREIPEPIIHEPDSDDDLPSLEDDAEL